MNATAVPAGGTRSPRWGHAARLAITWLLAALLAACATGPRSVDVSYDQLQDALNRRFPLRERILEVLEVQAASPVLQLLPQQNRLRVEMDLTATERLLRNSLQGSFAVSFAPRFDPADFTVRMADVRVERFDVPGVPAALRDPLQRVGPYLAGRVLEGATLHAFTPEQLARAQGYVPDQIRVTPSGVSMTLLAPVR